MKVKYLVLTIFTFVCSFDLRGQTNVSLSDNIIECRRLMIAGKMDSLSILANKSIQLAKTSKDTVFWFKFIYFKVAAEKTKLRFNGLYELISARNLANRVHDLESKYKFDVIIGPEYRLKGDYDSALYYLNSAMSHASAYYSKGKMSASEYMKAKGNLAAFYSYSGKDKLALSLYLELFKLADSLNIKQEQFNTHVNIGSIYQTLGNEQKSLGSLTLAKHYFEMARQQYQEAEALMSEDKYAQSIFYKNFSQLQYDLSDKKTAQAYMKKAISGFETTYPDKLCGCYRTLGDHSEEIDKEVYYRKAIEYSYLYPNVSCRLTSYSNLSKVLISKGKYSEAKDTLEKALSFEGNSNLFFNFRYAYFNLYELYKKQGDFQNALKAHERFMALRDSVFPEQVYRDINRMELLYGVESLKKDVVNLSNDKAYLLSMERLREEESKIRKLRMVLITAIALLLVLLLIAYGSFRIARQRQKAVEMEHLLLRARMNPHFIFNSLNTIQNSFLGGDINEANRFLSDFSGFLRQILYKTGKTHHSLYDELNLTEMYLRLEQKKYPGKFEFEIRVDENIDKEIVQVPTLILQPIVENAIFHGILNIEGEGLIEISVRKKEGDILAFELKDNGIGYVPKETITTHSSQGIKILKQRLGKDSDFNIEGMLDGSLRKKGTCVSFKIKTTA